MIYNRFWKGVEKMPPKKRISENDIIEAGLNVISKHGIDRFNAREIANELECSTQPIFSNFTNMDDLRESVYQSAKDYFNTEKQKRIADKTLLFAMIMEYVNFADKQKNLFGFLFMNNKYDAPNLYDFLDSSNTEVIGMIRDLTDLDAEHVIEFSEMMIFYIYGMARTLAMRKTTLTEDELKHYVLKGFLGLSRQIREKQGLKGDKEYQLKVRKALDMK